MTSRKTARKPYDSTDRTPAKELAMPGLFYQPISRKQFLRTAAQATAALALPQALGQVRAAENATDSLRVALLSDTHIPADPTNEYRGFHPVANLKQVVPQIIAAEPAMAIISGDAARLEGQQADYAALKELLAPLAAQAPAYIGLGNHDDRRNFFKVFSPAGGEGPAVSDKHVSVIDHGGLRFVVLDSLLYVNKVAGLLGKAQRDWLAKYLDQSDDRPHVLFVHHTLGDGDGDLLDVDRLFRMVEPHRKVKALFYGHSHRYAFSQHGHIHLINLPAVGYNFSAAEPVGWVDARFSLQGVVLTLHAIGGNRTGDGKTTSIAWG
jgi:Icc protein